MNRYELHSFGDWRLIRQLGQGGFGEVHLWQNSKTEQYVATKRLKENHNLSRDEVCKLEVRWEQEYRWMQELKTPFIVRGVSISDSAFVTYLSEHHAWPKLPVIIMEYCNGGDLRAELLKMENMNGLQEYDVRQVLYALRHAIEYLHTACQIEHRDLKPDNVVIHQENGKRVYKLTDFGFARSCTENTMLKSIVGTRNYVAPEMLETAKYNNTVDYWSLGIIAFELICGTLPFIPHQRLVNIVTNIRKKHPDCIAITEDADEYEKFIFHTQIFAENRMSSIFLSQIQNWLRLALHVDYKQRGRKANGELAFYSDLDKILASKVLTIFCLNTYKFYAYEVTEDMTMEEWCSAVEQDTQIKRQNFFLIFPTGHPRNKLSSNTKPIDFFVEEFQDRSDGQNPPVMLYLYGYQCDYNASETYVSEVLKRCVNSNCKMPDWLLQSFEQHTHFLLSNEQRLLEAYLTGLKEMALTMEHEILTYDQIQPMLTDIQYMRCQVDCFITQVELAKKAHQSKLPKSDEFFRTWLAKAEAYKIEIDKVEQTKSTGKRYQSVRRRSTEQATNTLYDKIIKADIYTLEDVRYTFLKNSRGKDIQKRIEFCRNAAYKCLEKRQEFLNNKEVFAARNNIAQVQLEFEKIKKLVKDVRYYLVDLKNRLEKDIFEMHEQLAKAYSQVPLQQSLNYDDASSTSLLNGFIHSQADSSFQLLKIPADEIYTDILKTLEQLRMEIDTDTSEIPTVITE